MSFAMLLQMCMASEVMSQPGLRALLYCLVGSWTRKHSIRMRTASHQMSALVGDRQVNRFEQVSNLSHQMTLVEGMGPCTEGAVYSEVQCIMDNGNMDTPMDRMMYRHD